MTAQRRRGGRAAVRTASGRVRSSAWSISPDPPEHRSSRQGRVTDASRLMRLKAIANTATAGLAMTSARTHGRRARCRSRFHPPSGYTARTDLVRRWKAPMFWKTGPEPGLSRFRGQRALAGPCWVTPTRSCHPPVHGLGRRPRVDDASRPRRRAPSAPARSSLPAGHRQRVFRLTRAPPRTPRRRADRRSGCSAQRPST